MYLAYEELQRLLENLIRQPSTNLVDDGNLLIEVQKNILELLASAKVDPQHVLFIQGVKRRLHKMADRLKDKKESIETIPFELLNLVNMLRGNFRETQYYGQSWLIERIQALGYNIVGEGICFGIASMALQAFLVNELETFNQRLKTIENLPLSAFYKDLEVLKQQREECLTEGYLREASSIQTNIIDIRAFCDGIFLHQSPEINDDFLRDESKTNVQDLEKTISLTRPVKLDTVPSSFKIKTFVGVYSENELQNYLDCLKKNLGNHSFSLILHCDEHAIFVSYNSEAQRWLFINPSDMPGVEYLHSDLLAGAILNCYGHAYGLSMATDIYAEPKHYQVINDDFLDMTQQAEWSTLHNVSAEKIAQADEYEREKTGDVPSESLLELAIKYKDIEWIQKALNHLYIDDIYISRLLDNAPPPVINFVFEKFEPSQSAIEESLLTAILQNQLESANILIRGIEYPSVNILAGAFSKKRTEILNMLLDKADAGVLESVCDQLNASSRDLSLLEFLLERFTPDKSTLNFACGSRNIEAVKLILTHLGDPKLSNEQCLKFFKYKFNVGEQESVCDFFLRYVPIESQKEIFSLIQPEFQTEIAQKMRLKPNVDNVTHKYKDDLDKLKEEGRSETSQLLSSRFK